MRVAMMLGMVWGMGAAARAAGTLDIYFVDVEGGQATLMVTPRGESVLVDAGWPTADKRDARRIAAAAKKAGISRIDYLVVTHYHLDHVGGVEQLAETIPVGTFVDHGPNTETGANAEKLNESYRRAVAKGKHLVVKPGDRLPVKGANIRVVAARGEAIAKPLKGGGANAACSGVEQKKPDTTENARSVGIMVELGEFRFVDLGDLTWNKELELACPENRLGQVDVYLTTHHGMDASGPAALVHALRPRVAIMNNGAKKGGSPAAWQVVKNSPGLEDFWQVHYAVAGGKENNTAEDHIANLEEKCEGMGLKVSANRDGSFTVENERNGLKKSYPRRRRS
jgi:beta-lactamase superfamily II metal-dependent hydrolase